MKTINRIANEGERIKIINSISPTGLYANGDIFTVRSSGNMGVRVEGILPTIYHMEYQVIEEEDDSMKTISEMNLDEVSVHMTEIIAEYTRKAYEQGYDQGKFDEMMEEQFRKVGKVTRESFETPQQKRDRIIDQAKKDVEELKKESVTFSLLRAKFVINREKRRVVCLLERINLGRIAKRGIAKCAPGDCFNVWIGKAIALRRALGLEIPSDYLTVPNPTEVRVGDLIKVSVDDDTFEVKPVISTERYGRLNAHLPGRSIQFPADYAELIDDSREEGSE